MNVSEAKELLNACIREELRDHAFGNAEVSWRKRHKQIAGGYFGAGNATIWISSKDDSSVTLGSFEGDEARELRQCGTERRIERNDETGPDIYVEGAIMPGLTLEGVRKEITTPPSKWDQDEDPDELKDLQDGKYDEVDYWAGETDRLLGEEIDRISNEERMTEAEKWDS